MSTNKPGCDKAKPTMVDIAKQLEPLQIAHVVIRETIERIEQRRDMGFPESSAAEKLAVYRLVLSDLVRGIEVGKDELDRI
jgi:hypothetical protein